MQKKQVNQTNQVTTRSNSKAVLHFTAIILTVITIVALAVGLFAWSKYTATQSGSATATVAKWNFNLSLKSGATTVTGNQTLNLADTLDQEATHVANGKIAPGTSGTFDIEIDTSGTEVSMVYDVTIGMTNCPRNITFSKKGPGEESFTVISEGGADNPATGNRTINFSKSLSLSEVTEANTNNKTYIEKIKWDWPYELSNGTATEKANYDLRDRQDSALSQVGIAITATGTETMQTNGGGSAGAGTALSDVTVEATDLGKYIDLGTHILDLNTTLADGNKPEADWRIFHQDADGGVWLMLADYLPNNSFDVATVGLLRGQNDNDKYGVYSGTNRAYMLTCFENSNWKNLINNTIAANNNDIQVYGGIDLPRWVASWNNNSGYPQLYYTTVTSVHDNLTAYRLGVTGDSADYELYLDNYAGYNNTLYFPRKTIANNCVGYRLASANHLPQAGVGPLCIMGYWGGFSYSVYTDGSSGLRPVVYLPSTVRVNIDNNGVWTIVQ